MNKDEFMKDLSYKDKEMAFVDEDIDFSEDPFQNEKLETEFNLNNYERLKETPSKINLIQKREEETKRLSTCK